MESYSKKTCLGYVVRHPFNDKVEKGKAQCWLIHGDAQRSKSYPDEVKIDRSTLTDHENDKLTYTKEFCGCEARVVHFPRLEFRSELAIERHNLATLNKEVASRDMEDGSIETKALKSDLADLKAKVKDLALEEVKYKRLEQFEGVYDWLPLRPPHRIAKGAEKVLPTQLVSAIMPGLIQNQNKKFSRYWHAPVRVSKIFKKSDLSAFLYLCMDKESKEENWYLATQQDPLVWAGKTFRHLMNQSQDEVSEALSDAKLLQKAFFRLSCVGTKIGRLHNMVKYKVKDLEISAVVDKSFLQGSEVPSDVKQPMPLHMDGCYANTKKAADAVEVKVLDEVGACPVDDLAPSKTAEETSFWKMSSLGKAKWVGELLGSDSALGRVGVKATKWYSVGRSLYRRWMGSDESDEQKKVRQLHDYTGEEVKGLASRMTTLLGGMTKLFRVMEAAGNTEDLEIKSVCAKEALDQIFEVGGLMPKVSQNLAMRPDLVKDDFVRNKLKETQNANPSRDEQGTMEYLQSQDPQVRLELGSGEEVDLPLLNILKYKQALSAGSVGQVDLFTLREDLSPENYTAFKKLLPKGHGDTVIVKTVFEETESFYKNDWNLLELFFTNCQSYGACDDKTKLMWKILEPMKKSIFDEFNLQDEASFTQKGQEMLAEFTRQIDAGDFMPALKPHTIKLTTPNAVATSSRYILIQSLAAGTPLKNYLEDSGGQIESIVDWRSNIYAAILMVYGHMVVKHGFFQSDPHNGNWFWEPVTKTVTLIDWGGVGQLDGETHCKLANLYAHLGRLVEAWNNCESVRVEGPLKVSGVYKRAGFSIYEAEKDETALLFGRTYGVAYKHEKLGYRLFYNDEGKWRIVKEKPGAQDLTSTIASLETKITNMNDVIQQGPMKWRMYNDDGSERKWRRTNVITIKKADFSCGQAETCVFFCGSQDGIALEFWL
ncbi:Uncharacterized protein L702 [Durusdinium trenchii]